MNRNSVIRWVVLALEILAIAIVIWLAVFAYTSLGFADGMYETAYTICSPGDVVNVRRGPSRKSESIGRFECGEAVTMDGKKKNGFLHCVNLGLEEDAGWIHSGYIVSEKPENMGGNTATITSRSKLAARKNIGGKRTRWLKPNGTLKVYYWTSEWSLTDCGYVQSKFIELGD